MCEAARTSAGLLVPGSCCFGTAVAVSSSWLFSSDVLSTANGRVVDDGPSSFGRRNPFRGISEELVAVDVEAAADGRFNPVRVGTGVRFLKTVFAIIGQSLMEDSGMPNMPILPLWFFLSCTLACKTSLPLPPPKIAEFSR